MNQPRSRTLFDRAPAEATPPDKIPRPAAWFDGERWIDDCGLRNAVAPDAA